MSDHKIYQRPNPYNKFLPYAADVEKDGDRNFTEIISNFKKLLKPNLDLLEIRQWIYTFRQFLKLYGFRFTLDNHVWLIKMFYDLLISENLDSFTLQKIGAVLITLTKKEYLLSKANLILEWKPIYKLLYKYEDSSDSIRGLIKVQPSLISTLKSVIKCIRPFFSHESTQEMLDEWRPLLCPIPYGNMSMQRGTD